MTHNILVTIENKQTLRLLTLRFLTDRQLVTSFLGLNTHILVSSRLDCIQNVGVDTSPLHPATDH